MDLFLRKNRAFVLNIFPAKEFSISQVLDLLDENQDTIIKRKGHWTFSNMLPKMTYESLKGPEDRFKNIFDNIDDVVAVCDLSCRILEVNKKTCEVLGYSREELFLMPIWELKIPKFSELLEGHGKLVLDSEHAVFEVDIPCRDGTVIPYEISTRAIDYMGEPAILSIGRDISEKKSAFETLKKSEEKFRNILNNFPDQNIKNKVLKSSF
ncbi:hypothetical protein SDC9_126417 [bioreactor metagenome]|uniref:histidine kinase n=1 Tax=bioreactor metagenome TaxID=1076179 RepID=A0A645CR64_9ZZZZ